MSVPEDSQQTNYEGLLTEISGALVDIASNLEKPKSAPIAGSSHELLARAIVEGLRGVSMSAPSVTVQAPSGQDWKELKVRVGKSAFDGSKEYTITKT